MSTASPDVPQGQRQRWARRRNALRWFGLAIGACLGGFAGWSLAPGANASIGPFGVHLDLGFGLHGGSALELPPFGEVAFPTHTGPLAVRASVTSVDPDGATELAKSSKVLADLTQVAPDQLRWALIRAFLWALVCTAAGAALAGWAISRTARRATQSAALAVVPILVVAGVAGLTITPGALQQPRFVGLLTRAPYLAAQGRDLLSRLESYRSGVSDMLRAVGVLYTASERLAVVPSHSGVITVLHISDVHLNPAAYDLAGNLIRQFRVNVVVDTGDVVTWGTSVESTTLNRISELGVPYVFVRGNHDSKQTASAVAAQPNAIVLEDSETVVDGLRFAGIGDASFSPDGLTDPAKLSGVDTAGKTATKLADLIQRSTAAGDPVDVALIHNAAHPQSLFGRVPLVLSGHFHRRSVTVDRATGTRVMVEGSTGGAGITSGALADLENSKPTSLEATLLYFSRPTANERAKLLAYDEVTVGGLGLTSVEVARTMVPGTAANGASDVPASNSSPSSPPAPSPTASAPAPSSATGAATR